MNSSQFNDPETGVHSITVHAQVTRQVRNHCHNPGHTSNVEGILSVCNHAGGTGQAIQNCDTERYAARAADKFTFLRPDRVMDSKKRRPDHPDYDLGTLYIPDNWFKANKISEGQQQWYALLQHVVAASLL